MDDKTFEVKGQYREKPEFWKPYTKVLKASNASQAEERVFTLIGSKHRLSRLYIKVESVSEINGA
jgi:large subunit ribosomal protein LX